MEEIWKDIEGTGGDYQVSNLGRVRSMKKYGGVVGRIMPHTKQHHGYHAVMFWLDGKSCCRKVHRLVAEAFLPNPDGLTDVNHKDGNKDNNQVDNLEWVTHQENVQHSFDTGLKKPHRWSADERKQISDKVKATLKSKRHQ